MNCPKCAANLPEGAAFCPACGAPRNEIDRLLRDAERAAKKAVDTVGAAMDRAAKELQPTFDKAVSAVRPARDVANAVRPAAETTAKVAKEVADKTIAAVKPAVTKAAETTESVARRVKERVQGH